ncbi:predicted protein [Uncinocarpus reesii 1704]|uniref:Uncharacterized protein n=1 Tax=Uncinocarpus reesii (strain UAMH 1704) TaxID=336963 RepID=C4JJI2_UNCRE|nr:uncharacterized protein UREG_01789 [Uncinocarpus reesii 1704]EEP76940.1 predicted protein [Uncinocarpus reesii 1704]
MLSQCYIQHLPPFCPFDGGMEDPLSMRKRAGKGRRDMSPVQKPSDPAVDHSTAVPFNAENSEQSAALRIYPGPWSKKRRGSVGAYNWLIADQSGFLEVSKLDSPLPRHIVHRQSMKNLERFEDIRCQPKQQPRESLAENQSSKAPDSPAVQGRNSLNEQAMMRDGRALSNAA